MPPTPMIHAKTPNVMFCRDEELLLGGPARRIGGNVEVATVMVDVARKGRVVFVAFILKWRQ
jgi:hypothetical protein